MLVEAISKNPVLYMSIGVAVLVVIAIWIWFAFVHKHGYKVPEGAKTYRYQGEMPDLKPNTIILDKEYGRQFRFINWESLHQDPGYSWRYNNSNYYVCKRESGKARQITAFYSFADEPFESFKTEEELVIVTPPEKLAEGKSPRDLWEALYDNKEDDIIFEMPVGGLEKMLSLGVCILGIGVLAICWVIANGGDKAVVTK